MAESGPILNELPEEDFGKIKALAVKKRFNKGDLIFSEGDTADFVYFIESGEVSVFMRKFATQEEICALGPGYFRKTFGCYCRDWQPVAREDIAETIGKLSLLRSIPNYYLRNFAINTVQDAIRMQFNCDGTHIVSSEDYQRFIVENL